MVISGAHREIGFPALQASGQLSDRYLLDVRIAGNGGEAVEQSCTLGVAAVLCLETLDVKKERWASGGMH